MSVGGDSTCSSTIEYSPPGTPPTCRHSENRPVTDCCNAGPESGHPAPDHCGSASESTSTNDEGGCDVAGDCSSVTGADMGDAGVVGVETTAVGVGGNDCEGESDELPCAMDGGLGPQGLNARKALEAKEPAASGVSLSHDNRRRTST
jgi:hypothetical protein